MTIEELRTQKIQQALDRYITVTEAAKALECNKRTVFRYIELGLVTRQPHYNCRPLEGWTKEQIKSTLKKHTKTELLKIAMQWRIIAEQLQMQLTELYSNDEEVDRNAKEGSDSSLSSSGEADNESEEKTIED